MRERGWERVVLETGTRFGLMVSFHLRAPVASCFFACKLRVSSGKKSEKSCCMRKKTFYVTNRPTNLSTVGQNIQELKRKYWVGPMFSPPVALALHITSSVFQKLHVEVQGDLFGHVKGDLEVADCVSLTGGRRMCQSLLF